jgi:hypothetical protein
VAIFQDILGETCGRITISKGERKYYLNLLVNLLPFWPTYALPHTGYVSLSISLARYFFVIVSILSFSSEIAFYGVTGFESDSEIGDKSS